MIELYLKISSLEGDYLNNLPEISNRTKNTISSTINLPVDLRKICYLSDNSSRMDMFLLTVDTTVDQNGKEKINPSR
jgi:hypothetical protein